MLLRTVTSNVRIARLPCRGTSSARLPSHAIASPVLRPQQRPASNVAHPAPPASRQSLPAAPPLQRKKHTDPNDDGLRGIGTTIAIFFGGFLGTVFVLSLTSKAQAPTRLLPNKYDLFEVLDVRRGASSPSAPVQSDASGDFVFLTIEAPHYIAPPKLYPEHLQLAAAGKPIWRIVSVYMKEPTLQIERPYTPLYATSATGPRGDTPLELLIKRYPDGELGRFAHRLLPGHGVELRGPEVTWQGPQTNHLVLLVGGTGITPAYQLITSILGRPDRPFPSGMIPRISLLYAAPDPSSLLMLPELRKLQDVYGQRLNVQLLSEKADQSTQTSWWSRWFSSGAATQEGFPLRHGRITDTDVKSLVEQHKSDSRQILVCGPDGMVAHVAGAKDGKRQGDLGGILKRIGCDEDEVWKL